MANLPRNLGGRTVTWAMYDAAMGLADRADDSQTEIRAFARLAGLPENATSAQISAAASFVLQNASSIPNPIAPDNMTLETRGLAFALGDSPNRTDIMAFQAAAGLRQTGEMDTRTVIAYNTITNPNSPLRQELTARAATIHARFFDFSDNGIFNVRGQVNEQNLIATQQELVSLGLLPREAVNGQMNPETINFVKTTRDIAYNEIQQFYGWFNTFAGLVEQHPIVEGQFDGRVLMTQVLGSKIQTLPSTQERWYPPSAPFDGLMNSTLERGIQTGLLNYQITLDADRAVSQALIESAQRDIPADVANFTRDAFESAQRALNEGAADIVQDMAKFRSENPLLANLSDQNLLPLYVTSRVASMAYEGLDQATAGIRADQAAFREEAGWLANIPGAYTATRLFQNREQILSGIGAGLVDAASFTPLGATLNQLDGSSYTDAVNRLALMRRFPGGENYTIWDAGFNPDRTTITERYLASQEANGVNISGGVFGTFRFLGGFAAPGSGVTSGLVRTGAGLADDAARTVVAGADDAAPAFNAAAQNTLRPVSPAPAQPIIVTEADIAAARAADAPVTAPIVRPGQNGIPEIGPVLDEFAPRRNPLDAFGEPPNRFAGNPNVAQISDGVTPPPRSTPPVNPSHFVGNDRIQSLGSVLSNLSRGQFTNENIAKLAQEIVDYARATPRLPANRVSEQFLLDLSSANPTLYSMLLRDSRMLDVVRSPVLREFLEDTSRAFPDDIGTRILPVGQRTDVVGPAAGPVPAVRPEAPTPDAFTPRTPEPQRSAGNSPPPPPTPPRGGSGGGGDRDDLLKAIDDMSSKLSIFQQAYTTRGAISQEFLATLRSHGRDLGIIGRRANDATALNTPQAVFEEIKKSLDDLADGRVPRGVSSNEMNILEDFARTALRANNVNTANIASQAKKLFGLFGSRSSLTHTAEDGSTVAAGFVGSHRRPSNTARAYWTTGNIPEGFQRFALQTGDVVREQAGTAVATTALGAAVIGGAAGLDELRRDFVLNHINIAAGGDNFTTQQQAALFLGNGAIKGIMTQATAPMRGQAPDPGAILPDAAEADSYTNSDKFVFSQMNGGNRNFLNEFVNRLIIQMDGFDEYKTTKDGKTIVNFPYNEHEIVTPDSPIGRLIIALGTDQANKLSPLFRNGFAHFLSEQFELDVNKNYTFQALAESVRVAVPERIESRMRTDSVFRQEMISQYVGTLSQETLSAIQTKGTTSPAQQQEILERLYNPNPTGRPGQQPLPEYRIGVVNFLTEQAGLNVAMPENGVIPKADIGTQLTNLITDRFKISQDYQNALRGEFGITLINDPGLIATGMSRPLPAGSSEVAQIKKMALWNFLVETGALDGTGAKVGEFPNQNNAPNMVRAAENAQAESIGENQLKLAEQQAATAAAAVTTQTAQLNTNAAAIASGQRRAPATQAQETPTSATPSRTSAASSGVPVASLIEDLRVTGGLSESFLSSASQAIRSAAGDSSLTATEAAALLPTQRNPSAGIINGLSGTAEEKATVNDSIRINLDRITLGLNR